jgi:hypothetical protein
MIGINIYAILSLENRGEELHWYVYVKNSQENYICYWNSSIELIKIPKAQSYTVKGLTKYLLKKYIEVKKILCWK